jgi:hypothetical protein
MYIKLRKVVLKSHNDLLLHNYIVEVSLAVPMSAVEILELESGTVYLLQL